MKAPPVKTYITSISFIELTPYLAGILISALLSFVVGSRSSIEKPHQSSSLGFSFFSCPLHFKAEGVEVLRYGRDAKQGNQDVEPDSKPGLASGSLSVRDVEKIKEEQNSPQ